ncbi:hypothetical protein EXU57_00220 [Segetibacter sp. 3557_3]|uniref:glycoside hydrolase family 10 protein n=1 Tax=Segetibacter sp. 3557_3 TaxID=2547429 RepID=UPI00105875BF|nr:family 10 glycosylhydrolase [Segetibacter sp. 3557_3]TDH28539.1 hypothetical protein EXU57_00220 [Segetibacter sp. 3557_3]
MQKYLCTCLAVFFFTILLSAPSLAQVRGTWVTNVGSDALTSKQKVRETVQRCKQFGLNTIYVVTWNNGVTMYPSEVVEKYVGVKQDPVYKGFDPIKEIIAEGHKAGLKVIGWFEFGFSYAYDDTSGVWLKKYPHWAGRDAAGNLLKKNKFYWWNSLHPEVQTFMNEMILEFVNKYNADGIQGDDRLPAMPAEGGYDDFTKALYAKEHNGGLPPANSKEPAWLQWRAGKLNEYGKALYTAVKKQRPGAIVSWAPSIYPWSKEQYLQDWPAWLNGGYADEILPQVYRYDIAAYEKTLKELSDQLTTKQKQNIFPGILTSLADGFLVKQDMLEQMVALNRKYGFGGESTFYYEGMKKLKPFYRPKR